MVGLEPGRLVGGHGKGSPVGLAEPEAAEGLQRAPDLVHHFGGVLPGPGLLPEKLLHFPFQHLVAQRPAEFVGARQPAAGHHIEGLQDLLVEDRDAVGFLQDRFQVRVRVDLGGEAVAVFQEGPDHV